VYVDVGFSAKARSSGIAVGAAAPLELTFAQLVRAVVDTACQTGEPMNLLIEAPLSVAFSLDGNPTGRSIEERKGKAPRFWYTGPGAAVLVAAQHLIRAVVDAKPRRDIRLIEGFASFKKKDMKSSHAGDVAALRQIVHGQGGGRVVVPEALLRNPTDKVQSAFLVMGLNCGVPPIVVVDG